MELSVRFPGKKKVDVAAGSFVIHTDQSPAHGGDGTAPEPFDVFLASIGACAGVYVLAFCNSRGIPTDEIRIEEKARFDRGTLASVTLEVIVPPAFPSKYLQALQVAASSCPVKRAFDARPEISIRTSQPSVEVRPD
ncbi:MAG TPA: OsmC family protein [Myxococcales bacterium]|nr:OsmC family protein [Myxococcales bacterium]